MLNNILEIAIGVGAEKIWLTLSFYIYEVAHYACTYRACYNYISVSIDMWVHICLHNVNINVE